MDLAKAASAANRSSCIEAWTTTKTSSAAVSTSSNTPIHYLLFAGLKKCISQGLRIKRASSRWRLKKIFTARDMHGTKRASSETSRRAATRAAHAWCRAPSSATLSLAAVRASLPIRHHPPARQHYASLPPSLSLSPALCAGTAHLVRSQQTRASRAF